MRQVRFRAAAGWVAVLALLAGCRGGPPQSGTSGSPSPPADRLTEIQAAGVLRVAASPSDHPRSWYQPVSQRWKGFDIDVAEELALRLGVEVRFEPWDWRTDQPPPAEDPPWDLNVGSMPVTQEHAQRYDFSPAYYYRSATVVVVAATSPVRDLTDGLDGATICVQEGSASEAFLEGTLSIPGYPFESPIDEPAVRTFATSAEALDQLASRGGLRCDAAIAPASEVSRSGDPERSLTVLEPPVFGEPRAIAFPKGAGQQDERLIEAVGRIVDDMQADDTLSELSFKWFGRDFTSL